MSGQHFSAPIYIGDYLVTGQTSDLQFEIFMLEDDKSVVHRNLSGDLDEIETRKENELMAVEAKFDINEPLDDVPSDIEEGEEGEDGETTPAPETTMEYSEASSMTTEQRLEMMSEQQEIENRYQSEEDDKIRSAQILEENIEKEQTRKELELEVLESAEQTDDEYLDETNMSYFNN